MTNQEVQILIRKYQNNQASPDEVLLLENWYARESFRQMQHPEIEDYARIQQEIWQSLPLNGPVKPLRIWPKIMIAAAAMVGIAIGIWFFLSDQHIGRMAERFDVAYSSDVSPGKNGAVVTLSNGKQIRLSSSGKAVQIKGGQLQYDDGNLASAELTEELTASTGPGQTYMFILQDGSRVWLNAGSSLKFPSAFSGQQRVVALTGEGYFEVSKNEVKPFVVKSKRQYIRVLGTHFNVDTYEDDLNKTTLLEGSVEVVNNTGQLQQLHPGQQALTSSNSIKVNVIDGDAEIDWVKGDFVFRAETLENIMKEVARWYEVQVIYEEGINKKMILGGLVSRSKNLSAVLKMMERTKMVSFKIDKRTITVMPY